jgi:ribosome-associated protein
VSSDEPLVIDSALSIPRHELQLRATRAGGPGGQHVNTSSTRIELAWNVAASQALTDDQRARIAAKLGSKVDAQGNVRVVASAYRSQARNRDDALERLAAMIRRALVVPKARKKTRPSKAAKEKRLLSKKHLSEKKKERRRPHDDV